jgi:hypothetical protein
MVAVAFQNIFHAEMNQKDIFFIFLKLFFRSAHQNYPKYIKILIFNKTKIEFFKNVVGPRFQTLPMVEP